MPVQLRTIPHRIDRFRLPRIRGRAVGAAAWSARHPRLVIGVWLVAILLGILGWRDVNQVLTTEIAVYADTDSRRSGDLIEARFRNRESAGTRVLCAAPGLADVSMQSGAVPGQGGSSPVWPGAVIGIGECYEAKWAVSAGTTAFAPGQRASDGSAQAGNVMSETAGDTARSAPDTLALLFPPDADDSIRLKPRNTSSETSFRTLIQEDLVRADRIALPLAFVVLLLVIRTWFSPFIPILIGGAAVAVAVGVTAVIARISSMSIYVVNMVVMLGLAVGIDYTLLILERFREERRAGSRTLPAIDASMASAGRAVMASGTTVIVALAGMLLVPISVFRDIAIGAILVVVLGVLAALTLLPAMLRLVGDRIDCRQRDLLAVLRRPAGIGVWGRLARAVTRKPLMWGVPVLLLLGALSSQTMNLHGGLSSSYVAQVSGSGSGPELDYWEQEVTTTLMSVVEVVVDERHADGSDNRIEQLVVDIGQDSDFAPVVTMQTNDAGDLSVIRALVVRLPSSPEAAMAVERLRSELVPDVFGASRADALVAGPLALQMDVIDIVEAWQWRIVAVILGMSFIILTLVFRSIVVPIVATLMTLLSVSAATGMLVLVVQKGFGASLLGLHRAPVIEVWVPIVLYSILFGLSLDYHVFLLSRIREQYRRTGDVTGAVAFGVRSTGGIICGAALIMAIVFGSFASGRLLILQQIGFGLAAAILIDAFLVRLILVPAAMTVLGRRNWYLWEWLPRRPMAPLRASFVRR